MMVRWLLILVLGLAGPLWADDKHVALHAPRALIDSGLFKYILPRFSLKTQVRVSLVDGPDEANLLLGERGTAMFQGLGAVWRLEVISADHPGTARLAQWLGSEVGQRTIASFAPEGTPLFGAPQAQAPEVAEVSVYGDAELGKRVSRDKCTRCHAVDAATRGWGIGSTPSFSVLRALPDWEERFSTFYILAPHPAFTQITDLTAPFPIERPSPISPIELTIEEVEAMLAYVTVMTPADLGKPLDHQ